MPNVRRRVRRIVRRRIRERVRHLSVQTPARFVPPQLLVLAGQSHKP
ncbi:MAG TPA: hypothetical protein VF634_09550 [Pyrinomonadaceae bacterium]